MKDYVPKEFYQFCDPDAIYQSTLPKYDVQEDGDFMRKKKKLFEAAVAARFAIACQIHDRIPYLLCLIPNDDDHDFRLKSGDVTMTFQLTETLEKGRMRDAEYKAKQAGEMPLREYKPQWNQEQYVEWIINSIKEKMIYSDKPHLLVYANFNVYDMNFKKIGDAINGLNGLDKFSSIWVIMTSSINVDETTIGRFYPNPYGWFSFDCKSKTII